MPVKYCVLGSNSFSGQDFVDLLLDDPAREVIGTSRSTEKPGFMLKYRQHPNQGRFRFQQLDMNADSKALLDFLDTEQPDYIVNFAAQSEVAPSWDHPEHWYETNTVGLAKLVNHLRKQKYLKRYLHISSPESYGSCTGTVREEAPLNPSTPYAASKAAADMLLWVYYKQFGFPLMTVRSTNVYGARQQLFKIIMRSIIYLRQKRPIELHGGRAVKSYIHIRDISRGELDILEKGRIGELYHLSPDGGISVRDIVEKLCALMGYGFGTATKVVDERPGQDAAYVIDSTKARTELGWRSTISLDMGLRECIDWVDAHWREIEAQPLSYIHKA
jgi:dTDP-glucose 4,6-dehydratase